MEFKTYNEALDHAFTNQLIMDSDEKKLSGHQSRIERLQRIIDKQEAQLKLQEAEADEDYHKGEAIYSHYQTITKIQSELNKARQKHSLKEIKEKLKGHKMVKDIKEKDKIAVIELD